MKAKPLTCMGCPAYEYGIGWVEPEGPSDAKLCFVGQGPGHEEAQWDHPFHEAAPSGYRLTKWMRKAGLSRLRVLVGNMVQCWLPDHYAKGEPIGNRDPTRAEQVACWNRYVGPWLYQWVYDQPQGHLIPLGGSTTKFLMQLPDDTGFEKWVGTTLMLTLPNHPLPEETNDDQAT